MGKLITNAQQVQQSNDTQYDFVPVPEWAPDGTPEDERGEYEIRIKSLTAKELIAFTSLKGENAKEGMVRALILSAVDEDGQTIFDLNRDRKWLLEKNISVLRRCQRAMIKLNGLEDKPEGEDDNVTAAGKG